MSLLGEGRPPHSVNLLRFLGLGAHGGDASGRGLGTGRVVGRHVVLLLEAEKEANDEQEGREAEAEHQHGAIRLGQVLAEAVVGEEVVDVPLEVPQLDLRLPGPVGHAREVLRDLFVLHVDVLTGCELLEIVEGAGARKFVIFTTKRGTLYDLMLKF